MPTAEEIPGGRVESGYQVAALAGSTPSCGLWEVCSPEMQPSIDQSRRLDTCEAAPRSWTTAKGCLCLRLGQLSWAGRGSGGGLSGLF